MAANSSAEPDDAAAAAAAAGADADAAEQQKMMSPLEAVLSRYFSNEEMVSATGPAKTLHFA